MKTQGRSISIIWYSQPENHSVGMLPCLSGHGQTDSWKGTPGKKRTDLLGRRDEERADGEFRTRLRCRPWAPRQETGGHRRKRPALPRSTCRSPSRPTLSDLPLPTRSITSLPPGFPPAQLWRRGRRAQRKAKGSLGATLEKSQPSSLLPKQPPRACLCLLSLRDSTVVFKPRGMLLDTVTVCMPDRTRTHPPDMA